MGPADGLDLGRVTDGEVAVVERGGVEGGLVGPHGGATKGERPEAEIAAVCGAAERRRAAAIAEGLVVLADDHRILLDEGLGVLDAGHGLDRGDQAPRHLAALVVAEVLLDDVARPRVGVDFGEHVGEEMVEGLLDRVGEHCRAGEERRAEHDRQSGEQQSGLAGQYALQGDLEHLSPRDA